MVAAGSVAIRRKTLPGAMDFSRFPALSTGSGHWNPDTSSSASARLSILQARSFRADRAARCRSGPCRQGSLGAVYCQAVKNWAILVIIGIESWMNKPDASKDFKPVPPGGASGKRRARATPKGRQLDPQSVKDIRGLLGEAPRRRDLLIEYLHLVQDKYGCIGANHLAALASEMRIPMAEAYEVATFYHHFDVLKEEQQAPPEITIRVCDSLSCELAGAQALIVTLKAKAPQYVRVVHAPCMGRCHCAPAAAVGKNYIDHAEAGVLLDLAKRRQIKTEKPKHQH